MTGRGAAPLVTTRVRDRAAQKRLSDAHGARVGRERTARCFSRSVEDFGRMGLSGTSLIVAAEHVADNRLHGLVQTATR